MQRIFAIDIGGTNARFSRFSLHGAELALEDVVWSPSDEFLATDGLLEAMQRLLQTPLERGDALAVALAGPVLDLQGKLTNGRLRVDLRPVREQYGLRCCLLLNDFMAEAWATLTPAGQRAQLVHGRAESAVPHAARAVLGAGTGLGAASLVWCGGNSANAGWMPLPSEAGHVPFAFEGDDEHAYQSFLSRELGHAHATAENVLSGEGLSLLHFYLTGQYYYAPVVGEKALAHESPTLNWYGRFLGRFCRQWICSTLCRGGLWIAGGIAARNPLCVTTPGFAQGLTQGLAHAQPLAALVEAVPVRLAGDTNSGLWGAAYAVMQRLMPPSGC